MIQSKNWRKQALERVNIVKNNTEKVIEKRKKNREIKQNLEHERSETPGFDGCARPYSRSTIDKIVGNIGQTNKKKIKWFHVQRWFIENISKNNPDWLVIDSEKTEKWTERKQTWWGWKEKNCAQRLLDHYGEDVVRETVEWFCNNWQGMVDESNGRLSGAPSVTLLWASRDRIFVDAKLGYIPGKKNKKKKKHMVGEYNAERANKVPGMGW